MAEIPSDARPAIQILLEWVVTIDRKQKAIEQILHEKLGTRDTDLAIAGFSRPGFREPVLAAASETTEGLVTFLKQWLK